MGLLYDLSKIYDLNLDKIGVVGPYGEVLFPLYHCSQSCVVTVWIGMDGKFQKAEVNPKEDTLTISPCTLDSSCRTSGISPHALSDRIDYIAADYGAHYNLSNENDKEKAQDRHKAYLEQLKGWADSPYATPKVIAIAEYVESGSILDDLVKAGILHPEEKGIDPDEKIGKVKAASFSLRFAVDGGASAESGYVPETWKDKETFDSWTAYYADVVNQTFPKGYCYETGEYTAITNKHGNGIRMSSDWAKLISSTEGAMLTYTGGRYKKVEDAVQIGYETSVKAHNALRWLISRQGHRNNDNVTVAWDERGNPVDFPYNEDTIRTFGAPTRIYQSAEEYRATLDEMAPRKIMMNQLIGYVHVASVAARIGDELIPTLQHVTVPGEEVEAIVGHVSGQSILRSLGKGYEEADAVAVVSAECVNLLYRTDMPHEYLENIEVGADEENPDKIEIRFILHGKLPEMQNQNIYLLELDSSLKGDTKGRLAIVNYEILPVREYDSRILEWHKRYFWKFIRPNDKTFMGCPSVRDIVMAAYGVEGSDGRLQIYKPTLYAKLYNSIVKCILMGWPMPDYFVKRLAENASHPQRYSKGLWGRVMSVACAVINGKEGADDIMLDAECRDRNVLFGRLLAVANYAERATFDKEKDAGRETNAIRYMADFEKAPATTWQQIYVKLQPYLRKLNVRSKGRNRGEYFRACINNITGLFEDGDMDDRKLEPKYLLGYSKQTNSFFEKRITNNEEIDSVEEEETNE